MGTQAELEQMFADAVDAFNNHDLDRFSGYLSDQVIVYSIRQHQGFYPKAAAKQFFSREFTDEPNFATPQNKHITVNTSGTAAIMSGQTTWTDENSPDGEQLLFAFTFVNQNGQWLFLTMWGAVY